MKKLVVLASLLGFCISHVHANPIADALTFSVCTAATVGNGAIGFWTNFNAGNTLRQKLIANGLVALPVIGSNLVLSYFCPDRTAYAKAAISSYILAALGGYAARAVANAYASATGAQCDQKKTDTTKIVIIEKS